jgi:hypothetical protein
MCDVIGTTHLSDCSCVSKWMLWCKAEIFKDDWVPLSMTV